MGIGRILLLSVLSVSIGLPCLGAPQKAGRKEPAQTVLPGAHPATSAAPEANAPTITFRKIFKGSSPEYVEIKVTRSGAGTYDIRDLTDRPRPEPFHVSAPLTARIFSLAAALHDFNGIHLNVRRLVANLGEKTFRFEGGGETHQVSFNYTVNSTANELLGIFEGLSLEDQYLDQLRRSERYDPLGLDDVLMRLQSDLESKSIPEPEALVPALQKIVSNPRFLNIARERASQILDSLHKRH